MRFITPASGDVAVFFHVSALREGDEITKGAAVKCEMDVDEKSGNAKAVTFDLV